MLPKVSINSCYSLCFQILPLFNTILKIFFIIKQKLFKSCNTVSLKFHKGFHVPVVRGIFLYSV